MTRTTRKIHVVGINSFIFAELSQNLQDLFKKTPNIAAPVSYFSEIKCWSETYSQKKKLLFASKSDKELINWLKCQKTDSILFTRGDPLWFGIGRILLENFSKEEICFYPAKTCTQIAFSKLKIPWQESTLISIHGRDTAELVNVIKSQASIIAVITDAKTESIQLIQKNLFELQVNNLYDFWICEELGFKNEKIRKINLNEKLPHDISSLNIVILLKKEKAFIKEKCPMFGLEDDIFKTFKDRPNLLTKREIRIQILADLELPSHGIIWDIGAGCGSIGIEALRLRPNLKLFCIDKRIGSKKLIEENSRNLEVKVTKIFEQDISDLLYSENANKLKNANRVIIGGCNLKTKLSIIKFLSKFMNSGDIIVVPLTNFESISEIRKTFIESGFEVNLHLIQTYKSLSISDGIRLDPNNPVFVMRGKK